MTGWLTTRFGRRRLMLWSVFGFAVASIMCGRATGLVELVIYRVCQGAFGAPLVPLSQAIILGVFPRRSHAFATAIWGMGVVFGPVIGPTVGGYLSEAYDWRWVFYIIAPFSFIALLGAWLYIRDDRRDRYSRLDWTGFITLSIAIAALQLMLDRGQQLDWFDSTEIVIEAAAALGCFYIFVVHILTAKAPYLNPWLLRDRNYTLGIILVFIYGMLNYTPLVLYPPMLQELRGYPDSIIGLLLAARGVGSLIGNFLVLWIGRHDPRIGLTLSFAAQAGSCWMLAQFDINMTTSGIAWASALQGFGVGLGWVPLTIMMFSRLDPAHIPEGTAVLHLLRNIGSSIYISLTVAMVTRFTAVNYADMSALVTPFNKVLAFPSIVGQWSTQSVEGLASLSNEVERQAAMIGYINAFYLLALTGFAAIPFICLVQRGERDAVGGR